MKMNDRIVNIYGSVCIWILLRTTFLRIEWNLASKCDLLKSRKIHSRSFTINWETQIQNAYFHTQPKKRFYRISNKSQPIAASNMVMQEMITQIPQTDLFTFETHRHRILEQNLSESEISLANRFTKISYFNFRKASVMI